MAVPWPGRFWTRREDGVVLPGAARQARAGVAAAGLLHGFKPAVTQILGRPADPLSISISYAVIRGGIGALGLAFPVVIIAGAGIDHVQGSLSAYYHYAPGNPALYGAGTMRDLFVGMLCAIGAFLFFYRGHSLQEDIALNIAGIAAVLVALFPMDWPADAAAMSSTAARLHSISAATFFVMLAYVCVFRARDTLCLIDDEARRRLFYRVYLTFGALMLATPVTVTLLQYVSPVGESHATLLVEVGGVFVFALFWLVKSYEIRAAVRSRRDRQGREVPQG